MPVTIKMIAKEMGLAVGTVSQGLRNDDKTAGATASKARKDLTDLQKQVKDMEAAASNPAAAPKNPAAAPKNPADAPKK